MVSGSCSIDWFHHSDLMGLVCPMGRLLELYVWNRRPFMSASILPMLHHRSAKNISVSAKWLHDCRHPLSVPSETPRWRNTPRLASIPRIALHITLELLFYRIILHCRSLILNDHSCVVANWRYIAMRALGTLLNWVCNAMSDVAKVLRCFYLCATCNSLIPNYTDHFNSPDQCGYCQSITRLVCPQSNKT